MYLPLSLKFDFVIVFLLVRSCLKGHKCLGCRCVFQNLSQWYHVLSCPQTVSGQLKSLSITLVSPYLSEHGCTITPYLVPRLPHQTMPIYANSLIHKMLPELNSLKSSQVPQPTLSNQLENLTRVHAVYILQESHSSFCNAASTTSRTIDKRSGRKRRIIYDQLKKLEEGEKHPISLDFFCIGCNL